LDAGAWQSDTVDFLAGNILLLLVLRALLAQSFSITNKGSSHSASVTSRTAYFE
jgi:hypothetical protein